MEQSPVGGTAGRLLLAVIPLFASGPVWAELSLEEIGANPDLWPSRVTITEGVSFGPGWEFQAGTDVDLCAVMDGEVVFINKQKVFRLEPEFTDLAGQAGRISGGGAQSASGRSRLTDHLIRNGRLVTEAGLDSVSEKTIHDGALFFVYYGNSGCGWCKSAHPFMEAMLAMIESRHPGRIQRVHANGDANSAAMQRYAMTLGEGWIVTDPADPWLLQNILIQGKTGNTIGLPTVALFTETGRLLTLGSRDERAGMKPVAVVLQKLDEMLVAGNPATDTVAILD